MKNYMVMIKKIIAILISITMIRSYHIEIGTVDKVDYVII